MPLLPESLSTTRLRLRKPRRADTEIIFGAYGQDPDVAKYMIWRPHTEVAQTEAFIEGCLTAWEGLDRLPYVITRQDRDEPIGVLDARFHEHMVDIGYVLAKDEWGSGLMPEAIVALVGALFVHPRFYRVQATCDVKNIASCRTLEKSGFTREGRLESYTVHPNISPEPRPCYMYARCRSAA